MRGSFKYVKTDKIIKWNMLFAGIFLLCTIGYIGFSFFSLPPLLPLFNQLPWGEERLGTRLEIFLPIVITASFLVFNFFLLNQVYEKMPLVSRMISITSLLISTLSFIFTLQTLHIIL